MPTLSAEALRGGGCMKSSGVGVQCSVLDIGYSKGPYAMTATKTQQLMAFVEQVVAMIPPCELRIVSSDRHEVELIIGATLTDEEWEFVRGELHEVVETDPLCEGIAPEGLLNDGDYDSDEEFDEDRELLEGPDMFW